jgi:hypothetical protein
MVHHDVCATSKLIYSSSKVREVLGSAPGHVQSSSSRHFVSNVQLPLYSAQCPGYHHKKVLQRTMSRVHHDQTKPIESSKTNKYTIEKPLESYKVSLLAFGVARTGTSALAVPSMRRCPSDTL